MYYRVFFNPRFALTRERARVRRGQPRSESANRQKKIKKVTCYEDAVILTFLLLFLLL